MSQQRPEYITAKTNGTQSTIIEPVRLTKRYMAYKKILLGAIQLMSGIYELATGERAPKAIDVLRS